MDENAIVTFNGTIVAEGWDALKALFLLEFMAACSQPNTYYSWATLCAVISPKPYVFMLLMNRVISNSMGACVFVGYVFTGKVSGKQCHKATLTEIGASSTLTSPGVDVCQSLGL